MIMTIAATCLALNLYHENRQAGYDGFASVAIVTMQRAEHDEDKVCEVVFKPKQFSWTNNLLASKSQEERNKWAQRLMPKEKEPWQAAKAVAWQALNGKLDSEIVDKIGSADHYYNPSKASPSWASAMQYVTHVGGHDFFNSKRKPKKEYASR